MIIRTPNTRAIFVVLFFPSSKVSKNTTVPVFRDVMAVQREFRKFDTALVEVLPAKLIYHVRFTYNVQYRAILYRYYTL